MASPFQIGNQKPHLISASLPVRAKPDSVDRQDVTATALADGSAVSKHPQF
jgi:hypothetical protein